MKLNNNFLAINIHQKPKSIMQWLLLSLQHVFAMFGSTVLVPYLVGLPISVAIFCSGIGTLIYILFTKGGSPVYLGSSFAFIIPLIAAKTLGLGSPFIGVMLVGMVYIILAIIINFIGTGWFNKLLPPVVIGPTIMVIGLSLSGVAISNSGLTPHDFSFHKAIIALVTVLTAICALFYCKGFLKMIPILISIIVGYTVSLVLGEVNLDTVYQTPWFSLPDFVLPFKDYDFHFSLALIALVVPVSLVTIAEHVGDHVVLSQIVGKNLIVEPGLKRTLMGDGVATVIAGALGGPVATTYAENTGVLILTRVASVYVFATAAVMAIIISIMAKFIAIIGTIPPAIMGGISIVLFGLIAINGVRVLINNNVSLLENRNLIIMAIILVIGIGGATIPLGGQAQISGMALATLVGIILNLLLPKSKSKA